MSAPTSTVTPTATETQRLDFAAVYANGYPTTLGRVRLALSDVVQRDAGAPEALAQEVWLRMWAHWDTLATQDVRQVYAYARQVTDRVVIDEVRHLAMVRRNGQIGMTPDLWEVAQQRVSDPEPLGQPEAQTLWCELVTELRATVRGMSSQPATRGRAAHLFEALLTDEPQVVTARRLGIRESAIKMSAWRMRETLKTYLIMAGHADGHTAMREEA
jgi:DNA-directed RNA polymerase specialized sigma24 family protein